MNEGEPKFEEELSGVSTDSKESALKKGEKSEIEGEMENNSVSSVVKTRRRVAEENGKFYSSIIDSYLSAQSPEEQGEHMGELVGTVRSPLKKLYKEGLKKFQEELGANHDLLVQNKGREAQFLLESVMREEKLDQAKIDSVLQNIDQTSFVEISPGVPVLQVERKFFNDFYYNFTGNPPPGQASCFNCDSREGVSFLITQRPTLRKSFSEEKSDIAKDSFVRHEFHHLLWNFLERRGDFLRKINEESPELSKAFKWFRDETSAYIIDRGGVASVDEGMLTYSSDEKVLSTARNAKDFITLCIDASGRMGVGSKNFLYASMTSRNFKEIKDKFAELVPIDGKLNQDQVNAIYETWKGDFSTRKTMPEFLKHKDIEISPELLAECGLRQLMDPKFVSLDQLFSSRDSIEGFAEMAGVKIDGDEILKNVAMARLLLPKETVEKILELPPAQFRAIQLNKSAEEFLESFVSFWSIDKSEWQSAYKEIINSSPVVRSAFEKIKGKIIKEGEDSYRVELKSRPKKDLDEEVRKRTQLIMEL